MDTQVIVKIQSICRGILCRIKRLPNSICMLKKILQENNIKLCEVCGDGRINSSINEKEIINIIISIISNNRIHIPKDRCWYDILIYDYLYGWLPINIKATTAKTSDNTGNLAMCVYAYTNEKLDLFKEDYKNGDMSKILIHKLNAKNYNYNYKKDYYFIVVNKCSKDIIINSVKGLTKLTPNINNLPFQVCWNNNLHYKHKHITISIEMLLYAIQKPNPSWNELFLADIRKIAL